MKEEVAGMDTRTLLELYPRHMAPYQKYVEVQNDIIGRLPGNIAYLALEKTFDAIYYGLPPVLFGKGLVGLEFEIEKIKALPGVDLAMWSAKNDSSLKDNGVEFVSTPVEGDNIRASVAFLKAFLQKFNKVPPSYSWRTSTHVHLNVQDFKIEEIYKLILLYMVFEYIMFAYAGEERAGTNFCVPLYDTQYADHIIQWGIHDLQGGRLDKCIPMLQHWEKYSALNLGRLLDLGTVEFRHMGGTDDYGKVMTWVNVILSLRQAAKAIGFNELLGEIESLNTTSHYQLFKEKVFGYQLSKIFPNVGLELLMSKGVMSAKCAIAPITEFNNAKFETSAFSDYLSTLPPAPEPKMFTESVFAKKVKIQKNPEGGIEIIDDFAPIPEAMPAPKLDWDFDNLNQQVADNLAFQHKAQQMWMKAHAAGGGGALPVKKKPLKKGEI